MKKPLSEEQFQEERKVEKRKGRNRNPIEKANGEL